MKNSTQNVLLREVGDIHVHGICNRYENRYDEILEKYITREQFSREISSLNDFLQKNIPSSDYVKYGCFFCFCTFGLSFVPLCIGLKSFDNKVEEYIENLNYKYSAAGLKWSLERDDTHIKNNPLSYLIISVPRDKKTKS
jgi:hypothetical protein